MVGHSFSGKSYLLLKTLSRLSNQDIYKITKSPPEQCSKSEIKIKEIGDEIKTLRVYKNANIVFDDILGSSSSRYLDQFYLRGRHNNLDNFYLSQSYFDLPKKFTKNSNKIILFKQTLEDIKNKYRDVDGYDLSYHEFKDLSRKSWEDEYFYLCIDRPQKDNKEDTVFVLKRKTHL